MSRQALRDFKKVWLNTYIKQYKEGNREERRAIKRNIYKKFCENVDTYIQNNNEYYKKIIAILKI